MRLRTCSSASRSRCSASAELEPLDDVERLEQLDLLLEGEVRRVAGGVGQRARLGDRAHEGANAPVVAAQLEDLLDDGAVLALELAGAAGGGVSSGRSSTSTRRRPSASVCAAPATPRCRPVSATALRAAGQADALDDLGDDADLRVVALVPRDEQDALVVADVGGSVTSMLGKTTVSSSGTSSRLAKISSHSRS